MSDFLEICDRFYVLDYFISCGLSNINHFFSGKIKFVQRDPFMCLTTSVILEIMCTGDIGSVCWLMDNIIGLYVP